MNAPSLATFQPSFVRLLGWLISLGPVLACVPGESGRPPSGDGPPTGGDDEYARQRASMVDRQLHARDIDDPQVLEVMARVPRHEFVPEDYRDLAYADRPLPIEKDQTISQPYIVALMTQLARPQPGDRALDVGTGSGYQAAVLAELVDEVYSIEIHEELADSARARLARLGYRNVEVRHGDGYRGWPEAAPFDLIIVAASPPEIPRPLIAQLAPGGRLILPVGEGFGQELVRIEKAFDGTITRESIAPVSFVPMTGEARHDTDQDR
ncbi:protein-L-isoaspartate(D-aspartate) O-methyltransferase [Tautonia marina]|uniref:protein-L-isoaspartate(D-aspartate) O-methyltransferase n=1 Tax=Tautonia marina TaxID=2653855 RepID=UPI00191BD0B5|nr:protein-L-isoaspartate(D-aspartate) O-methyltransferase [Tautonia marina]